MAKLDKAEYNALKLLIAENKIKTEKILKKQKKASKEAEKLLGRPGAMMCGSKSFYAHKNPRNMSVFNGNICTANGKIWYGDIDITLSEANLVSLSKIIGEPVYVLSEMHARFENENAPLLNNAVVVIDSSKSEPALFKNSEYYERATRGKLKGYLVLKKKYEYDMSHLYGRKRKKK